MIDHVGFPVSDYRTSKAFYETALAPLGAVRATKPKPRCALISSIRMSPLNGSPSIGSLSDGKD